MASRTYVSSTMPNLARCTRPLTLTMRSQQALARCSRTSALTQRTSVGTVATHEPAGGGAMYFVHWPKLRDHDSRWRDVLRPWIDSTTKGLPRLRPPGHHRLASQAGDAGIGTSQPSNSFKIASRIILNQNGKT